RATTRGKKVGGRKRHVLVDTLGLLWGLAVLPADVRDRDGAKLLLGRLPQLPRLAVIWADGAYTAVVGWVLPRFGWIQTAMLRPPGGQGHVHPAKALERGADVRLVGALSTAEQGLRAHPGQQ